MPPQTTDHPALEAEAAPRRRGHRGQARLLTLGHLDGRSRALRGAREIQEGIEADLGGADHISTAQRALAQRAAILTAVVEDAEVKWATNDSAFELDKYLAAVNCLRRVLASVGLERRQRDATPSLDEYLAERVNDTGNGNGATSRRTR